MKSLFLVLALLIFPHPTDPKEEFIQPEIIKHFTGLINGKYKIFMNLSSSDGGGLTGNYRYASQTSWLNVKGGLDQKTGSVRIDESADGKVTGSFTGKLNGNSIEGTWSNPQHTKTFPFQIATDHVDVPVKFLVNYSVNGNSSSLVSIGIWSEDKKTLLQHLDMGKDIGDSEAQGERPVLTLEDVNFDGYPDLNTLAYSGVVNSMYYYWLYDPASETFIYNEALHTIQNPEIDIERKCITSFARDNAATYTTTVLEYKDGKYQEVRPDKKH